MPPKAEKKPTTAGKAPAGKAPAEKKEAGKKTAAPSGEKKKRSKTRKETYSSYIYKGTVPLCSRFRARAQFGCLELLRVPLQLVMQGLVQVESNSLGRCDEAVMVQSFVFHGCLLCGRVYIQDALQVVILCSAELTLNTDDMSHPHPSTYPNETDASINRSSRSSLSLPFPRSHLHFFPF
jgi:hypothetical protein